MLSSVEEALTVARLIREAGRRPSLVCCKTVIGRGAPTKQGHHDTHGAARHQRGRARAHRARLAACAVRDPRRGWRSLERTRARPRARGGLEP
jgi:transketolase